MNGKAKKVTWCSRCESWRGVTNTPYNRMGSTSPHKIVQHKREIDGQKCPGSGEHVHANVVMDREEAKSK
jgi:hypothetical protein